MFPTAALLTPEVRAVVFDLDGTLYDKKRLAWRILLSERRHISFLLAERKARHRLMGECFDSADAFYERFFACMAKGRGFDVEQAKQWYWQSYLPNMVRLLGQHYSYYEWVVPFLEECKRRRIRMAVYSDYERVRDKLQAIGLCPEFFSHTLAAPLLGGLKPAKECAERVTHMIGVSSQNVLFIGDRMDTDAASAIAIGARYFVLSR